MSEIVELVGSLARGGWQLLCAAGVVALGLFIIDRGRKAAAAERAEETRERRAA